MSEQPEEPGDKVTELPPALKELSGSIHDQQKAIVVAVVGILLFLCAPHTDELLRAGMDELGRFDPVAARKAAEARLQGLGLANEKTSQQPTIAVPIWDKLKAIQASDGTPIFAGTPDFEPAASSAAALGVLPTGTLAQLLDLVEGRSKRCEPMFGDRALQGLAALRAKPSNEGQAEEPLQVRSFALLSVRDEAAQAAVTGVFEAAMDAARGLEEKRERRDATAGSTAPGRRDADAASPAPAEYIVAQKNGRNEWTRNPAFGEWLKKNREQSEAKRQEERATRLVRKGQVLFLALERLRSAVETQVSEEKPGPPRFVVARIELAAPSRFTAGSAAAEPLLVPLKCASTSIFPPPAAASSGESGTDAARSLRRLRATDEWDKLSAVPLDMALEVGNQELLKKERTLDIFGFQVQERLVSSVAPWLLSALLFWHVIYVWRFRREVARCRNPVALRAAAVIPTVPTRQNWPLPLATALGVAFVSALLLRLPSDAPTPKAGDLLAILLAVTGLVLTLATSIPRD